MAEPIQRLPERFGRRVAMLRGDFGWSQTELAERLAMSRTAVSHLEASMRDASERTIIVLAGLFRMEPRELVAGTDYPRAKAERLPATVARYREIDVLCALAEQDCQRAEKLGGGVGRAIAESWVDRLTATLTAALTEADPQDAARVAAVLRRLRSFEVTTPSQAK
jgi:transcriptional regulator with XRE-family HTH domain